MKTIRFAHAFLVAAASLLSAASADTHYVDIASPAPDAPYTNWGKASLSIQSAINAASNGDEILVAPGTYLLTGSALYIPPEKALVLRSTQSRAAIIDAQGLSQGLLIQGTNSLIEGFTVRNGLRGLGYGGGISIGRDCTVRDCLVISNRSSAGGGIMINGEATNALVEDCTVEGNIATNGPGGGIVIYDNSRGRVHRCVISGNTAATYGGGVWIDRKGTVSNCWVMGNEAEGEDGGGVYMACQGSTNPSWLVNSVIAGNSAARYGGGVYSSGPAGTLSPVVNCTIVSNTAGADGGGVFAYTTRFINDIIYFNSAPTNANLNAHDSILSCIISNCCTTSNYFWPNITNAPAFVDAVAMDFRLATASFCIDAGTTNSAPGDDIDGNPRPRIGKPGMLITNCDMGAHEYGFHFNEIRTIFTNSVQVQWDVQDRGIYRLQAATNAADDPLSPSWGTVVAYTNGGMAAGQFQVYTQTVSPPGAMPGHALFRLQVGHTMVK